VSHVYADHVSILKFIERNWKLQPLMITMDEGGGMINGIRGPSPKKSSGWI
jgi:hypothetical protein